MHLALYNYTKNDDNSKVMFPVIIAIIICLAVIAILVMFGGRKSSSSGKKAREKVAHSKNRAQIIRDATKKLSRDPHNIQALTALGELYFSERLWDKALPLYNDLANLAANHPEIEAPIAYLRYGICCLHQKKPQEAMTSLITAYKLDSHSFDVNFYLGKACFESGDFEKAIPCFKKAYTINPEATGVTGPLGAALYKAKKYKEALPVLRKALDENPQNKEALFSMADSMQETGMGTKALKVFMHLRPDPVYGPKASLTAGIIHARMGQNEEAVQDYEIGLKLKDIPQDTLLELNYRLAQCYFSMNKIALGLACLSKINTISPNYKDVSSLMSRYKELNQNSNLQIYLNSGTSDFVAICRKLVTSYYDNARVKITDVEVQQDTVEISCEVDTSKWEDNELFKFYKMPNSLGELPVREFLSKIQDKKVDRGFCITPGVFSDEAHKYVEGRSIDLVEKEQLMRLLKKVTLK